MTDKDYEIKFLNEKLDAQAAETKRLNERIAELEATVEQMKCCNSE